MSGSTDHGYIGMMPPGAHSVQPSGTTSKTNSTLVFDAVLIGAVMRRGDRGGPVGRGGPVDIFEPIYGLTFNLIEGDAARIRLTTGAPYGGVFTVREFTLTRSGVWVVASGWATVKAERVGLGPNAVIGWAWTDQPPRPPSTLQLVETVALTGAGGAPVPFGAVFVATSLADPNWQWLTDQDGAGALTINQPQPGGGEVKRVLGARYVATVANTVTWLLEAQ